MNQRAAGDTTRRYRWVNGGLALVEHRGAAHMRAIGANGGRRGMAVYGDSVQARRLRASDLRRKRTLSPLGWAALMRQREQAFGLPAGRLAGKEVGDDGTTARHPDPA